MAIVVVESPDLRSRFNCFERQPVHEQSSRHSDCWSVCCQRFRPDRCTRSRCQTCSRTCGCRSSRTRRCTCSPDQGREEGCCQEDQEDQKSRQEGCCQTLIPGRLYWPPQARSLRAFLCLRNAHYCDYSQGLPRVAYLLVRFAPCRCPPPTKPHQPCAPLC